MNQLALFESKPRWDGAPKICLATNLPAFKDAKELEEYRRKRCPSSSVAHTFTCRTCGLIHVVWNSKHSK